MIDAFHTAKIRHFGYHPEPGTAAHTEIPSEAFDAAQKEVSSWDGYTVTPLIKLDGLAREMQVSSLLYKDEGQRFDVKSFKGAGGAYAVLRLMQRELTKKLGKSVNTADILAGKHNEYTAEFTLAASTDGNHGISVAWGSRRCGAKCRIYFSNDVSEVRAQTMRDLGATIVRTPGGYARSAERVRVEAEENGWFLANDTATPGFEVIPGDILAGYGLMAREIVEQVSTPPTHLFLQAAVGGMAAAVSAVMIQRWGELAPRIVIMETEHAANLLASAQKGMPIELEVEVETIMGGLSCGEYSTTAWNILSQVAQDFMTVPDSVVPPAMRLLAKSPFGDPKIQSGETGVAGLCAALCAATQADLRTKLEIDLDSRILVIGTEGVTDPEIYASIVSD